MTDRGVNIWETLSSPDELINKKDGKSVRNREGISTKTENNYDYGGEEGIRTLGAFRHTRFPSVRTRPLCDLSLMKKSL